MSHKQSQFDQKIEAIRAGHDDLHDRLGQLRRTLRERSDRDTLARQLMELSHELSVHFELEEAGYLNEAVGHAPDLVGRAAEVLAQHGRLLRDVNQLARIASAGGDDAHWWQSLEHNIEEFIIRIVEHENAEHELLRDAMDN